MLSFLNDISQASKVSNGGYVEYGYGQVEPNHLSAQRNGQIYAQLPANKNIKVLENGQFVKYDYAAKDGGEVNFTGKGEWMLVFNEIKLYHDNEPDCAFALKQGDYFARIYSPVNAGTNFNAQSRFYGETDPNPTFKAQVQAANPEGGTEKFNLEREKVVAPAGPYELNYTNDPFHIESQTTPAKMPTGTTMVPRVLKTNIGDIMTTNMIKETTLELGDVLTPQDADGILAKANASTGDNKTPAPGKMVWQVVKIYTMPDHQKGVKLMRIQ